MRAAPDFNETYPFTSEPASGWGNPNTTNEWVLAYIPGAGFVKLAEGGKDYTVTYDRAEATRFKDASEATIASVKLKSATDVAVTN